jgi:hypothetical protein
VRAAARRKILSGTLEADEADLKLEPYWPSEKSKQAAVDLDELRRRAVADPLLVGGLVGADGRSQAMVVRLKAAAAVPLESQKALEPRIREVFERHGLGQDGVYVAGMVPAQGWIFGEMDRTLKRLMPLGGLILAVALWLLSNGSASCSPAPSRRAPR